ncbi:alkaline phosphatase family protein [Homoserinibacter sp. GY 40078]|uniref:alkaline phosphatase family protein n=1 Tax=Homoserinibacter sp. GY 40078 TaxID=2603275 RepID=UPI002103A542|nr:alkaline phosphatase family protein [Homoserinibacter sp. GY 40078]
MTRHVVLIGVDGLRIDDALAGGDAPALTAFVDAGSMASMEMEVPTLSGPGWASILTGASHAEHGVRDNFFSGHNLLDHADFLSRAWFADQTVTTWVATSWPPIADPAGPAPIVWWRDEARRSGRHNVIVRDGETYGYSRMDGEVVAWSAQSLRWLGPRASFIYLGEVDLAGHLYGGAAPEYRAAVASVDGRLATLIESVRERAAANPDEEWLVAITTDHGHLDIGGHGGSDPILTRAFLAAQLISAGGVKRPALPTAIVPTFVAPYLLDMLAGGDGLVAGGRDL